MGGFVERTAKEKEYVPAAADALVAMVSGCAAAVAVAPFLMCVDRGVVAAAAGTAPGGSLFRAIASVAGEFVTKPKIAFTSPALWMVAGVYGATYATANSIDAICERVEGVDDTVETGLSIPPGRLPDGVPPDIDVD